MDFEKTIAQLQDTMTVMAGIQARQAEVLKGHGQWLLEHDRAMAQMREKINILLDSQIATERSLKAFLDSLKRENGRQ